MKIQYLSKLCLLGLLLAVVACSNTDVTDEVNINVSPQLVVVSFISPQDTALLVKLQKTQPAVGKAVSPEQKLVPDATVQLSDGSQTVTLRYEPALDVYRADASELPIIPGKTYFLNVTAPGGFSASATSTVPRTDDIRITDISMASEDTVETLSFEWQDAAGQANYYRPLGGTWESIDTENPSGPPSTVAFEFTALGEENLYSDENADGEIFTSPDGRTQMPYAQPLPKPYRLQAILAVTDRHYYRYHRSVYQQQSNAEDPFAEPTQIYSNVQGGLGVFASFNEVRGSKRVE